MTNFVKHKNAKVAYYSNGKGSETIVLLHGFLENSSMWKSVVDEFSNEFRIISVDLLGHGKSECLGYVHTMEEMAEAVYQVLQAESIKKITVVGHSMGGYVALALAEKHPEIVNKLCLLNATSKADSQERKKTRTRAIQMAKTNFRALVSMSISNLFSSVTANHFIKEIEHCKQEALKTSVQGYIACAEGMKLRKEQTSILKKASFESLFITGKNDPILPFRDLKIEAEETNTPLVALSNGHMSHIENKTEVLEALHSFFNE